MTERLSPTQTETIALPEEIDVTWIADFNNRFAVTPEQPRFGISFDTASWLEARDDTHPPRMHKKVEPPHSSAIRIEGTVHSIVSPMLHPHQYRDAQGQDIPCLLLFAARTDDGEELRELREGGYILVRLSEILRELQLTELPRI
ncbi:TPA: hypothetical protein DIV49_03090 [Candidatus Saccharibacteria bacterium]|nr:hypothetical protein [Candidatus Saccharibacteria bacterium]HRJ91301.1 hypothetical protein [Candidatus Saccharibacteria bacterium]